MKRIMVALALLAGCASAQAADVYQGLTKGGDVPATWSGGYMVANTGYGWDDAQSVRDTFHTAGLDYSISGKAKPSGWAAGGGAGWNWQLSNVALMSPVPAVSVVMGFEVDTQIANIEDNAVFFQTSKGTLIGTGVVTSKIDWFGTARARLGVLVTPATLVYGTGGLAFGGGKVSAQSATANVSNNETRVGWALGGGVEYRMTSRWALRGEFLHVDLASIGVDGKADVPGLGVVPVHTSAIEAVNLFRVGLAYSF